MAWLSDTEDEHREGFLVALHEGDGELTELTFEIAPTAPEMLVDVVQVGCACGWRSERLTAPAGTRWRPYAITLPPLERYEPYSPAGKTFEDRARALWEGHCWLRRNEYEANPGGEHG